MTASKISEAAFRIHSNISMSVLFFTVVQLYIITLLALFVLKPTAWCQEPENTLSSKGHLGRVDVI